jgi:predicted hotdog family 3-hydroxylacyl-ACP dehydratase
MLLLDRLLGRGQGEVTCTARVEAGCPLVEERGLPSWALPEQIAQAGALLRGLEEGGDTTRPGFLAALSEVRLTGPAHLPVGAELEVSARRRGPVRDGMAMLDGEVRWEGRIVCAARLVVKE